MIATVLATTLVAFLAYIIGSIPFGLLLTQAFTGTDIRQLGSGNIGATNVLRTGAKGLALATLILDAGKALLPLFILRQLQAADLPTEPWWPGLVALSACLGHCYSVWLKFRGGKAVASSLGAWLGLSLGAGLTLCLTWLVVAVMWRRSSLAALSASFAAPILAWGQPVLFTFMVCLSGLIWFRHRDNLSRLLVDREPLIGSET